MRAGAPLTPGRHSRAGSMADAGSSPRVTPRHSRTSSIEALANAASFVQPYKASIIYGAQPPPDSINCLLFYAGKGSAVARKGCLVSLMHCVQHTRHLRPRSPMDHIDIRSLFESLWTCGDLESVVCLLPTGDAC